MMLCMARSVRIEYPGAVYHVMCRGDRKDLIFDSDRDPRVDAGMSGKQRDSYESGGMRGYDEREAGRLLMRALDRLDVTLDDVRGRRQADAVKQAVAWWIKSQTVVGDAWLCRELQMGHRVNVSRAVKRYREPADAEARIIRKMFVCTD